MAHHILPQHRPHEQLRTEPPSQRPHTDKYVSAFVSSSNQVDMTFTNPILQESADHFRVGVDELTINSASLSLLDYENPDQVLFRIIKIPEIVLGVLQPDLTAPFWGHADADTLQSFTFQISRRYRSMGEIYDRFRSISQAVGTYVQNTGLVAARNYNVISKGNLDGAVINEANIRTNSVFTTFSISITPGGSIKFSGNKLFWANFAIHIPLEKYRKLLTDDTREFLGIDPQTGAFHTIYVGPNPVDGTTRYDQPIIPFPGWTPALPTAATKKSWIEEEILFLQQESITGTPNIYSTLDRRVSIEVGCSLPIKNSPMMDHGKESPDFVIGRFHLPRMDVRGIDHEKQELRTIGVMGPLHLQGPKDRICYHHLGPQQKIQQMRLRLWARVRTYDAAQKTWGMKTIMYPVDSSDYWHIRLHFIKK